KQARALQCRDAYRGLVEACARDTGHPAVEAVAAFLEANEAGGLALPEDFAPGDAITFRVDGVYPMDLPEVRRFWAARSGGGSGSAPQAEAGSGVLECLVCGEMRPAV